MQQYLQNKKGLVDSVFDQVYNKYDLMNDFMSLGVHRFWKKSLINMMNPSLNKKLIDVACGTGDIGKIFLDNTSTNGEITCVDPNKGMVSQGKQKLSNYKNIRWLISSAEKLPLPDNTFDFYTIGFGLRSWRYAMIVNDKNIEVIFEEPGYGDDATDDPYLMTDPNTVLNYLKEGLIPATQQPQDSNE